MDFNINLRYNRSVCLIIFAFFVWSNKKAVAQSACVTETVFSVSIQPKPTAAFNFSSNGLTAIFQNNSSNAGSWLWDFGNGQTSIAQNPTQTFASPGNYTVSLTATNANGCGSTTISQQISVSCPPISVSISAATTAICPNETAQLSATAGFQNYQWQLEGQPILGATGVNFSANSAGNFSVVASDAAGCTGNSTSILISEKPLPTANFSHSQNDLTAAFSNTSTNSTTYFWTFGDPNSGTANTSNLSNPSHVFSSAGNFTVVLTATNDCGTATFSQQVNLNCPPISVSISAATTAICPNETAQLSATAGFQNYQWQLEGQPILGATGVNFSANSADNFSVVASDAAGCTGNSTSILISEKPLPTANFSHSQNDLTATFSNTSTNSTTYFWTFGDPNSGTANTSNLSNPSHVFSSAGNFTVVLTATNDCGTATFSQQILANCPPISISISASGSTQICAGESVILESGGGSFTNFQWFLNGQMIAGATAATFDATASGIYKLEISDSTGCTNFSNEMTIEVSALPVATVESPNDGKVCEGTATWLQGTGGIDYQWLMPDGTMSLGENIAIPTANFSNNGTYHLTVTDGNGCTSTAEFDLTVNQLPLVSISGLVLDYKVDAPPVPLIGTPVGGIFSGSGVAGDLFDPSAAGVGQHTIYYTYTDANNCTNEDSVVVNISPTSATSSASVIGNFRVFPNPNQGDFWLEMVLPSNRILNFGLMNTLGQTLASRQEWRPSGQSMLHFSSHELNSGVYILKVMDGEQYACIRVIVSK